MDVYERNVRRATEADLGSPLADEQWDYFAEQVLAGGEGGWCGNLATDTAEVVRAIRDAQKYVPKATGRAAPPPTQDHAFSLGAPDWWAEHSRHKLEEYRTQQRKVLSLFDLDGSVTVSEMDALVRDVFDSQNREGLSEILEYGAAADPPDEGRRVLAKLQVYEDFQFLRPRPPQAPPGVWRTRPSQPLFLLARLSLRMESDLGCEPWQAVDWLLCDIPFELPWVVVQPWQPSGVMVLRVGTPAVPASYVAKAYAAGLDWLRQHEPEALEAAPKRKRRPRQRTLRLLTFVDTEGPARGLDDWRRLRDKWNPEFPHWEFPTPEAMREAHRRARSGRTTP